MKRVIEHPVISSVLAGLILSFLAWLSGIWPTIWTYIKVGFKSIYEIVTYRISVQLWLLMLLSLPLISILRSIYLKWQFFRHESEKNFDKINQGNQPQLSLTDGEIKALQLFIEADGRSVKHDHLRYRLNLPMLKIEQIIESLEEKGLINVHSNYIHGSSLSLTRIGRDFMIGNEHQST